MIVPSQQHASAWVEYWAPRHLCLTLPPTFDDYWQDVHKDVRTQCRKASRGGYVARWSTSPNYKSMADVWHSWTGEVKQGRLFSDTITHFYKELGEALVNGEWPFQYHSATPGWFDLVEVVDSEGCMAGFLELVRTPTKAIVMCTITHKDARQYGVAKLMFVEAIKGLIERGGGALYYLKPSYLHEAPHECTFALNLGFEEQVC